MENAPAIGIFGYRLNPEMESKYLKWSAEAYAKLELQTAQLMGSDRYRIIKGRPEYPGFVTFQYYNSLQSVDEYFKSDERNAVDQDRKNTFDTSLRWVWRASYELVRSVDKRELSDQNKPTPIVHLEGFSMSQDDEKLNHWFNRWGYSTYLPLLMKTAGLTGFALYRFSQKIEATRLSSPERVNYPQYLSLFGFESAQAFNIFENSLELAAFRGAIETGFANSYTAEWYVQYELMRSLRK